MDKCIYIEDDSYPGRLRSIPDPPSPLYYKGAWRKQLFLQCLGVVGTRRMTSYGERVARDLVREIAGAGITIVSGFMYGIDATAHRAAVEVGGRTIAVMPCGIDVIHPAYQEDLYREILNRGGLVVSEYEGTFPAEVWTYPARNRIVAGLSQAVLVIEGGARSGSLITARLALEYGRKLFAVPGQITSSVAEGTLALLKSKQAEMVTVAADVLKYYRIDIDEAGTDTNATVLEDDVAESGAVVCDEASILSLLQREALTVNELSRKLGASSDEVGALLSLMELQGAVIEKLGKYHVG